MTTIRGRRMLWPRSSRAAMQPEQPEPPRPSRAPAAPQSRFVEGSMNDRASAAPPPGFLGADDIAAYERQFYDADRPRQLRPVTSTGHYSNKEHEAQTTNPLAPSRSQQQQPPRKAGFWDGVRERFSLTRSKSEVVADELPRSTEPNPAPASPPAYPTREQVLESYQSLVASGFFDAHAIQGARHPLPRPHTTMGPPPPRPISSSAAPQPFTYTPRPSADNDSRRGTKRPSDVILDTDSGARKLVKRLRHSASRISMDLSGKPAAARPSMPSRPGSFMSVTSSAASSIHEVVARPKAKLSKPMPPMTASTRAGGWRRSRSRPRAAAEAAPRPPVPNPLAMNPVAAPQPQRGGSVPQEQMILHIPLVDDAMLDPETPRPSTETLAGRPITALHPPPRAFHYPSRTSPRKGPLRVVPDANRGVPRMPISPSAKEGGGVFGYQHRRDEDGKVEGKAGGRDSGLGVADVEMVDENGW